MSTKQLKRQVPPTMVAAVLRRRRTPSTSTTGCALGALIVIVATECRGCVRRRWLPFLLSPARGGVGVATRCCVVAIVAWVHMRTHSDHNIPLLHTGIRTPTNPSTNQPRPSQLGEVAGQGVFVTCDVPAGTVLCEYRGEPHDTFNAMRLEDK